MTKAPRQGSGSSGRELVQAVASRLGRTLKAIAIDARCQPSVLSESLAGTRNFALDWLLRQDDEFLTAFIEELATERRLTVQFKRAIVRTAAVRAFADAVDEILDRLAEDSPDWTPDRLLERATARLQLLEHAK